MKIKQFIESVLQSKTNELQKYSLGKLSHQEIKNIKEATGLDLRNFTRSIDSFSIKHILKKHGNPKTEILRGQIAVTPDDLQKIKNIVKNADNIKLLGKAKRGGTLIEYSKVINVEYVYVEERRGGIKELATKTMYKKIKKL